MGGKYHLIDELVPIIEWCADTYHLNGYLELCGGGARCLLNISTTKFHYRLYNDISLGLSKLFACLRNPQLTKQMINLLLQLEYNEENFDLARELYDREETDVVTAGAYTYLLAQQSRAGNMKTFDRISQQQNQYYYSNIYGLQSYSVILKGVDVTCGDALSLLKEHASRHNYFCYLDVPYVTESKKNTQATYKIERDYPFDHEGMVDLLLETKMKVALSGYDYHHYYDRLSEDNGWHKIFLKELFVSSSGKAGTTAEEYLWVNFDIPEYILKRT